MLIKYRIAKLGAIIVAALLLSPAQASDSAASAAPRSDHPYVKLDPSFVTNYDGGGRLRYLKVDVAVRVYRPTELIVLKHMPYLRNALVALFSSQLEENLSSTQGIEKLREEALVVVRNAVDYLEGEGSENITELYFTSFVVQQ